MVFDFIKKHLPGGNKSANQTPAVSPLANYKPNPKNAAVFIDRAKTVADTGNYEFALTLYVSAIKCDPANLKTHEALREVAMKYKVTGGKPMSMIDALKSGGKEPLDKLAHAITVWAKDPLNFSAGASALERLAEVHRLMPEAVDLKPVIDWMGKVISDGTPRDKKNKAIFLKVCDVFASLEDFERAVESCNALVAMDPDNDEMRTKWRNLETERTIKRGKYESGDFKNMVKDMAEQKALDMEDQTFRSEAGQEQIIARRRAEYDQNPEDIERIVKLVQALLGKEDSASEAEALTLLEKAYKNTTEYRYKMQMGDLKLRQIRRQVQEAKNALAANPDDAELKQKYSALRHQRLEVEIAEFTERVKNYPTDMKQRYELGLRLYEARKFDEAIQYFQDAQTDPKNRIRAMFYLSSCYEQKSWFPEAIETLDKAISTYPVQDDNVAMDMRYLIMKCHFQLAKHENSIESLREAQRWCSQILQTNINYKDIRDWSTKLRQPGIVKGDTGAAAADEIK